MRAITSAVFALVAVPGRFAGPVARAVPLAVIALAAGVMTGVARTRPTAAGVPLLEPVSSVAAAQPNGARPATQVLVPILNWQGDRDFCRSWVAVQNVGHDSTQAVLVAWDESEPDGCDGPLKNECTGLIKPGGTWHLLAWQIPTGTRGAIAFSLSPKRLSDIGVDFRALPEVDRELGADDTIGDYVCERLFYGVVNDCDDYAAFKEAFDSGGEFKGIPMDLAAGSPIAVHVWRACPGDVVPGVEVGAAYTGIGANVWGTPDQADGNYAYYAAPVVAEFDSRSSLVYLQNGGSADATADMWLLREGECGQGESCGSLTIRPGETVHVPALDCVGPGWNGGASIRSDQPLGVVVENIGRDALTAFVGVPQAIAGDAAGERPLAAAADALFGPLAYDTAYGWELTVTVQNLSPTETADVVVQRLDAGGNVISTWPVDALCAGGSRTILQPYLDNLPGFKPGSIRALSQPPVGDPAGAPAPIGAVATLTLYPDAGRSRVSEAVAYNLVPEGLGMAWPTTLATPSGLDTGVAAVAVPAMMKDLDWSGITTELSVANLVDVPGWTDTAILIYDQNDLVEVLCRRLADGEVEYINLQLQGALPPGLIGSAFVSATHWEHRPPADPGAPTRNLVGLAAAAVWRTGTSLGAGVPGDEAAAVGGVPLRRLPEPLVRQAGAPCSPDPAPATSPTAVPRIAENAALAGQIHLPAVNNLGNDSVCGFVIEVFNTGSEPAMAAVIQWGEPGFCSPQCAGPLFASCTGLIAPGESWFLDEIELDAVQTASAVVYSFNTRTLAELGVDPGTDQPAAEHLCEELFQNVLGDCEDFRRFKLAYGSGLRFADVPLDQVVGPPLDVFIARKCDGDDLLERTSDYAGLSALDIDADAAIAGGHWQTIVPAYGDSAELNTWLHIQNAGTACTGVDLWFQPTGGCLRHRKCTILTIAPGETMAYDTSSCTGPSFEGSVVLHGEEPLAVVGETDGSAAGQPVLWARRGYPGRLAYDLNGDASVDGGDAAAIAGALGARPGDPNWNPRADLSGDQEIDSRDLVWLQDNLCREVEAQPPEPPRGPSRSAVQVVLPVLRMLRDSDVCETWIAVQNVGSVDSKAVIVLWGSPPADGQPCAGPLRVECTGLIRPGAVWHLSRGQIPAGAKSAIAFSFNVRDASELFQLDIAICDTVADIMCETLFYGVTGDCEDYRHFKRASDRGTNFAGIPMDKAWGSPLAVHVNRSCPGDRTPGAAVTASYAGLGANLFGRLDPLRGKHVYYAPLVQSRRFLFDTTIYVQNAGSEPAEVTLRVRAQDECSFSKPCGTIWTVEPGESVTIVPGSEEVGCIPDGWQGNGWLMSTQPLGVAVEFTGRDTLMSYTAVPAYADFDAQGEPLPEASRHVAYGPIIYDTEMGWDHGVQVQNLSSWRPARVRVEFRDDSGTPIRVLDDVICPNGSQTYFDPVVWARAMRAVGSVRVESQRMAADSPNSPAPIAAIGLVMKFSDGARTEFIETGAYNLLPEAAAFDWPVGRGAGGTGSGSGVVALPSLVNDPVVAEATGEIAITNLVLVPGSTDALVRLYDRNGIVRESTLNLRAGQVAYMQVPGEAQLGSSFLGGAVVSAVAWEHRAHIGPTGQTRNLVGLAAAVVHRRGTSWGTDVPGDEIGLTVGIPLSEAPGLVERLSVVYLPALAKMK